MLSALQRYLPILFTLVMLISLYEFASKHWPAFVVFLHLIAWYLVAAAILCWLLLILAYLHKEDRLPEMLRHPTIMDILDRLTDRQAIEAGMESLEEAMFIDAESLSQALKQQVIGQNAVCDDMAAQIRRRLALTKRGKPVGVFLLAGPPGTGKTLLAKVLAKELERHLLHLDMSQYASGVHSISELFGISKGYVGSDSYGVLTRGLRDTPSAVVLLDEIEKAHPDVLKAFLTAWNDGFITERSDGSSISTTRSIFILTSNAATDKLCELSEQYKNDQDGMRQAAVNTLKEIQFAPEVLNRIDRIFVFQPLQGLDIARVAAIEIEEMIHSYGLETAAKGIDPQIILMLMQRMTRMGRGGSSRDLVRAIEEKLADSFIEAKKKGYLEIALIMNDDGHVAVKATKTKHSAGQ